MSLKVEAVDLIRNKHMENRNKGDHYTLTCCEMGIFNYTCGIIRCSGVYLDSMMCECWKQNQTKNRNKKVCRMMQEGKRIVFFWGGGGWIWLLIGEGSVDPEMGGVGFRGLGRSFSDK